MKKSIIGFILIALIGVIVYSVAYYSSVESVIIKVTDKERITESTGDEGGVTSKYLVFTETETFENTDAFIFGKWNSSDIQGRLRKDSTYTVKVVGWRIPFFSSYRNIIEIIK